MRIVYLTTCSPIPPTSGHALRVAAIRRALAQHGDVCVYAFDTRPPPDERVRLAAQGIVCLGARVEGRRAGTARHLNAFRTGHGMMYAKALSPRRVARLEASLRRDRCDLLIVGDTWLAELVPSLRAATRHLIVDTHNVESELYRRLVRERPWSERPKLLLFQRNVVQLERRLAGADMVWAASPADEEIYARRLGLERLATIPNAIDTSAYRPEGTVPEAGSIVFTGTFGYWPNQTAAMHLIAAAKELTGRGVAHRVRLVGRNPTPAMVAAARTASSVEITGEVADIRPWIARAAIIAAPLSAGSGTKFKVLEAMALGRPVVTTPIGAEGLSIRDGQEAAIVSDLAGFADRLQSVLVDPIGAEAMGARGRIWVERTHSLSALDAAVSAALARLAA